VLRDLQINDKSVSVGAAITAIAAKLPHDPHKGRDRRREYARDALEGLQAKRLIQIAGEHVTWG
jgi:hypothetical protein